jgi:LemA protein
MTALIIIIIIALLIVAFVVATYNRLIGYIEAVRNNQKQIDIQLDRRFKVFESLVNVLKNYMDYERSTLKDVVALRSQAQQAHTQGDEQTRITAENKISQVLGGLNLVFEQYPNLKANENALQLQEEIVNTENKLAFAKQSLNDSIERYNADKKSFFASMVVSWFKGKLDFNFDYWQLNPEQVAAKESYTVKLEGQSVEKKDEGETKS